jgi:hypothetical protein
VRPAADSMDVRVVSCDTLTQFENIFGWEGKTTPFATYIGEGFRAKFFANPA